MRFSGVVKRGDFFIFIKCVGIQGLTEPGNMVTSRTTAPYAGLLLPLKHTHFDTLRDDMLKRK